jgi:hypothetical protein
MVSLPLKTTTSSGRLLILLSLLRCGCRAFVPFLDGGKEMPALYSGWLNGQIAKQVRVCSPAATVALALCPSWRSGLNEAGHDV